MNTNHLLSDFNPPAQIQVVQCQELHIPVHKQPVQHLNQEMVLTTIFAIRHGVSTHPPQPPKPILTRNPVPTLFLHQPAHRRDQTIRALAHRNSHRSRTNILRSQASRRTIRSRRYTIPQSQSNLHQPVLQMHPDHCSIRIAGRTPCAYHR